MKQNNSGVQQLYIPGKDVDIAEKMEATAKKQGTSTSNYIWKLAKEAFKKKK